MSLFEFLATEKQQNMVTHTHTIPTHATELKLQTWPSSLFSRCSCFMTHLTFLKSVTEIKALLNQVIYVYICTERLGICAVKSTIFLLTMVFQAHWSVLHIANLPVDTGPIQLHVALLLIRNSSLAIDLFLQTRSCVFERRKLTPIKHNSWNDLYLKPG